MTLAKKIPAGRLVLEVGPGCTPLKHDLDRLAFSHGTRGSVELE